MYSVALSIHVLAAVFGAGQVLAMFLVAVAGRRLALPTASTVPLLRRLLLLAARGFVGLFVSGAILDFTSGRAFDHALWFRVSAFLLLALGVLAGLAARELRRQSRLAVSSPSALRGVERIFIGMSLLVGAAVVLMAVKPW